MPESFVPQTFIGNHDVQQASQASSSMNGPSHALVILMTSCGLPSIYVGVIEQAFPGNSRSTGRGEMMRSVRHHRCAGGSGAVRLADLQAAPGANRAAATTSLALQSAEPGDGAPQTPISRSRRSMGKAGYGSCSIWPTQRSSAKFLPPLIGWAGPLAVHRKERRRRLRCRPTAGASLRSCRNDRSRRFTTPRIYAMRLGTTTGQCSALDRLHPLIPGLRNKRIRLALPCQP